MNKPDWVLEPASGLVRGLSYLESPHCDERPAGCAPELLVIHAISLPEGEFGGDDVTDLFLGRLDVSSHPDYVGLQDLQVAAHFFIRRDGSVLQFVPVHRRAWHAGISEYRGRSRVNDFSIGVELEGCDDQIFEDDQYQALVWLTELLSTAYPVIGAEQIVGHSDIAAGRKTDPGAHFDWARYRQSLLS